MTPSPLLRHPAPSRPCPGLSPAIETLLPPGSARPVALRSVRRGEVLYRWGDPFSHLFRVQVGSFKSVWLGPEGRQQVMGFHLPGELLGLDGLGRPSHACEALALEDSVVWLLPNAPWRDPSQQAQWQQTLCDALAQTQQLVFMLGSTPASGRLASFLLDLGLRLRRQGFSASRISLRMSREDIGSYLGLTVETISRLFSRLDQSGVLRVQRRDIQVLNLAVLQQLSQGPRRQPTEATTPGPAHAAEPVPSSASQASAW
ncbi:helix-turn-helix domain-containing protein [Curvibacter sp. RS43]|uniref:Crp/Fnr family transcriptional regulator n=1 Tax=Curvibacter microcysteis TaxID=3026419 RepID=UPI002361C274|nr:helix-turn-helix domain-containing protein [Curvibacter sp. RS43]MDD0809444.1 helix-turn-helix domain-containing protein [Curvibacter sp. RS43]